MNNTTRLPSLRLSRNPDRISSHSDLQDKITSITTIDNNTKNTLETMKQLSLKLGKDQKIYFVIQGANIAPGVSWKVRWDDSKEKPVQSNRRRNGHPLVLGYVDTTNDAQKILEERKDNLNTSEKQEAQNHIDNLISYLNSQQISVVITSTTSSLNALQSAVSTTSGTSGSSGSSSLSPSLSSGTSVGGGGSTGSSAVPPGPAFPTPYYNVLGNTMRGIKINRRALRRKNRLLNRQALGNLQNLQIFISTLSNASLQAKILNAYREMQRLIGEYDAIQNGGGSFEEKVKEIHYLDSQMILTVGYLVALLETVQDLETGVFHRSSTGFNQRNLRQIIGTLSSVVFGMINKKEFKKVVKNIKKCLDQKSDIPLCSGSSGGSTVSSVSSSTGGSGVTNSASNSSQPSSSHSSGSIYSASPAFSPGTPSRHAGHNLSSSGKRRIEPVSERRNYTASDYSVLSETDLESVHIGSLINDIKTEGINNMSVEAQQKRFNLLRVLLYEASKPAQKTSDGTIHTASLESVLGSHGININFFNNLLENTLSQDFWNKVNAYYTLEIHDTNDTRADAHHRRGTSYMIDAFQFTDPGDYDAILANAFIKALGEEIGLNRGSLTHVFDTYRDDTGSFDAGSIAVAIKNMYNGSEILGQTKDIFQYAGASGWMRAKTSQWYKKGGLAKTGANILRFGANIADDVVRLGGVVFGVTHLFSAISPLFSSVKNIFSLNFSEAFKNFGRTLKSTTLGLGGIWGGDFLSRFLKNPEKAKQSNRFQNTFASMFPEYKARKEREERKHSRWYRETDDFYENISDQSLLTLSPKELTEKGILKVENGSFAFDKNAFFKNFKEYEKYSSVSGFVEKYMNYFQEHYNISPQKFQQRSTNPFIKDKRLSEIVGMRESFQNILNPFKSILEQYGLRDENIYDTLLLLESQHAKKVIEHLVFSASMCSKCFDSSTLQKAKNLLGYSDDDIKNITSMFNENQGGGRTLKKWVKDALSHFIQNSIEDNSVDVVNNFSSFFEKFAFAVNTVCSTSFSCVSFTTQKRNITDGSSSFSVPMRYYFQSSLLGMPSSSTWNVNNRTQVKNFDIQVNGIGSSLDFNDKMNSNVTGNYPFGI